MRLVQLLAAIGGLVTVLGGIGGLSWWSARDVSAAPSDDWRPRCIERLGWDDVKIESVEDSAAPPVTLFGLDVSPSNEELATAQLDAAVELASALPATSGTGILLVSDRSDLSSTPDLPLEAPAPLRTPRVSGLPCWPDCETDSLFAQRCKAQLTKAVDSRLAAAALEISASAEEHAHARAQRLEAWRGQVAAWRPRPGTSLLRFWHKVADLPQVRRSPSSTRVVLLSDLEEARTRDRAAVERFHRAYDKHGTCPERPDLPDLEGVEIILLQTVTDRIRPEPWGERWEAILGCAGADVRRHRYSPAIPLEAYLAGG